MSYLIAFIIIIVAAGALLLFRQPVEAPEAIMEETARTEEVEAVEQAEMDMLNTEEAAALESETSVEMESTSQNTSPAVEAASSYEAEASYFTPKRTEHDIGVTLELEGTTIVAADVTYDGGAPTTPQHSAFDGAYASEVIGKNVNDVQLSRVGGASLTSDAFNEAVAEIRAQL